MSNTELLSPEEIIENVSLEIGEDGEEEQEEDLDSLPDATFEDLFGEEITESTFQYSVGEKGNRRKMTAKRLQSLDSYLQLVDQSESFRALCSPKTKEEAARVPPAWKPYLKGRMHKKTAMLIVFASSLLIKPRLSQFQCIKLAAKKGGKLLEIAGPLLGSSEVDATEAEDAEIEAAKND